MVQALPTITVQYLLVSACTPSAFHALYTNVKRMYIHTISLKTKINIENNLDLLEHQVNRMLIGMNISSNMVVFSTLLFSN